MAPAQPTPLAPASSPLSEPLLPPPGQPERRTGEADRDLEGSIANASAPDRGGPTQTHNAAPTEAVGENRFLDVEQGGVYHESSAARLSSSSSSDASVWASGSSPSSSSSSSFLRDADSRTRPSIPPLTAAASTRGGGTAAATAAAAAAAAPFGALASRFLRQSSRSSSGRGSGSGGGGGGSSERWLLREESANGAAGTSQQPPPDANRPQLTEARDADDQQGLRTSEWAYSRPVVLLDLLWNAAFIAAALVTLALSTAEHPGAPLRVWVLGYSLQCAVHMACVWAEYDRRRRHRLRLAARERRNRLLLQRRQQQQRQQRQAQRLRQLTLTGRSRVVGLGEREAGGVQEQEEQQWRSQGLWLPGPHRGSEEQQLRQGAAWGEGSSAGGAVTDSRTWATARGHVSGQGQQQHQQHGQRELGETRPDDVTAADTLFSRRSSGGGGGSGSDSGSGSRRSRLMARLGFMQQGRLSRLLSSEEEEGVEREEQDALRRGGREEGDASSDDSDTESFPRRVESANTMLSFLWWGLGLCWLLSTFDDTFQDSPMLSWLVTVFLAFDVFFVVFCAALACVIGVAVCCCLPCIIAMLYAVGEQEGASEEDIQALPRFKYTRLNPQAPCSEPQQEKEVASTTAGTADGTSTQAAAASPAAAAAAAAVSEKEAAEHRKQIHVGGGGHTLGPCSDAQNISLESECLPEEAAASPAPIPHPDSSSSSSSTDVVVQVDKDSSTASPAPAPQGTQETAPAAAAAAATEAAVASGGSQRAAGGAAAAGIARPLQSRVGSSVLGAIATTAAAGLLGGGAGEGAGGGAGEKVIGEDDAECCICLCAYDDGTILRQLPCGHHFHLSCVDKWLRSKPTCPLCKFDIVRRTRVSDTARQSSSSSTASSAPSANRGSGTASTRATAAAQQDLPRLQQAGTAVGGNEGGQSRGSALAADDASRNVGSSRTTPEVAETAAALLVPETVETSHELMVGVGEGFFGRADTRLREFFQRAAESFREDAH